MRAAPGASKQSSLRDSGSQSCSLFLSQSTVSAPKKAFTCPKRAMNHSSSRYIPGTHLSQRVSAIRHPPNKGSQVFLYFQPAHWLSHSQVRIESFFVSTPAVPVFPRALTNEPVAIEPREPHFLSVAHEKQHNSVRSGRRPWHREKSSVHKPNG